MFELVLITPRGAETVVAREVRDLLGRDPVTGAGAVSIEGGIEDAYRLRLGVRCASRLLMVLARFDGTDGDAVYEALVGYPFDDLFGSRASFSIEAVGRGKEPLHFLTLRAKDAVVDRFRARRGARPDVDKRDPDVRLHLRVHQRGGQLSLDLGDGSLSNRGYRPRGAAAPLRESLAATLLLEAGFDTLAAEGRPMVDPMCGSGTLVIEAGLIAAGVAPGLFRPVSRGAASVHDWALFESIREELEARRRSLRDLPPLVGRDVDPRAIELARQAARRAGLEGSVHFERGSIEDASPPEGAPPGLVLVNPPYGERLGDATDLLALYERLGDVLRWRFFGYRAGVFTADATLARRVGLKPAARRALKNGPLEATLTLYAIDAEPPRGKPAWKEAPRAEAEMFENRLSKNLRRLAPYVKSRGLEAYRLYDRDIPEYAFAIDRYGDRLVVQEWAPPAKIDPQLAASRARDVRLVLERTLGVPAERVHFRRRRRRGRFDQVDAAGGDADVFVVAEGEHRFEIRLDGRLDTGLYLDHRELRRAAAEGARGTRFLNLFAYTGTASVVAAAAGAEVVSVDLSRTYLDWAARNFRLAGLSVEPRRFVKRDAFAFLEATRERFDTIFCNPPSYSRSRASSGEFDVKRDHGRLIELATSRLERGGKLFFSTHARGFELSPDVARSRSVRELSPRCVPPDFRRDAFRAYLIEDA